VWLFAGAGWLTVVAMLGVQLGMLEDQRSTVDNQLEVAVTQLREVQPLIRAAKPVVAEADADRPAARRLTRRSLALTEEATPLLRELRATGAARQLASAGGLAASLQDADAAGSLTATRRLADSLLAADAGRSLEAARRLSNSLLGADAGRSLATVRALSAVLLDADVGAATVGVRRMASLVDGALASVDVPGTAASLKRVTDELSRRDRLRTLLVRSTRVLGQVEATQMVPKVSAAADVVPRLQALLERSLAVQEELLVIGRDTNRHAASLDRKLGGEVPVPAPTATAGPRAAGTP
jgi:hypothetical protein